MIAAPAVPVGGYTRTVLRKMGLSSRAQQGRQPGVGRQGRDRQGRARQADAGFVYVTDARPVSDQVTVIRIPAWAQPRVRYEIAIVSRSTSKAAAQAWIKTLLAAEGRTR